MQRCLQADDLAVDADAQRSAPARDGIDHQFAEAEGDAVGAILQASGKAAQGQRQQLAARLRCQLDADQLALLQAFDVRQSKLFQLQAIVAGDEGQHVLGPRALVVRQAQVEPRMPTQ